MMTRTCLARTSLLAVALLAALPLAVSAESPAGVTVNIFNKVVDEQPTGCPAYPPATPPWVFDFVGFKGDLTNGPASVYGFGSPWILYPTSTFDTFSSAKYVDGGDCNSSSVCLNVHFTHNSRTLLLDTGPAGTRTVVLNFSVPHPTLGSANQPLPFLSPSKTLTTTMMLSFSVDEPFTGMGICSSADCPESQPAFARLRFDDPGGDQTVAWRVNWSYVRVLRMSESTWYVVADSCDGSQVASLYKLHKNSWRLQGWFLMPHFVSTVK